MPAWLKDSIFYEIYPQSFYDSNGDGIGDINGITEKLDYVLGLGCNAIWINPCYDSPFKDAGYDVRDYKKVAPRYGTNEDLYRLFDEAHKRGIHVLLDLVAGHTSEEHEWFLMSGKAEENEYSNRYIWTEFCFDRMPGFPYIAGECERNGAYLLNFFKCQPALNYGFLHSEADWQFPIDHPDCLATREALKDIMRFWLDHGCDGFRVDMAKSLVKNDDEECTGVSTIWREIRRMLDDEYPEAAMVSEWNDPQRALRAGFHMDFFLNEVGNGYNTLLRDYGRIDRVREDHSYFKKDGSGDINRFLSEYIPEYEGSKDMGYFCLITGNHDTVRAKFDLDDSELKIAYAFILTMPGVPYIYYGDEIGMRYLLLPTKEGGYFRTGTRTPMQWNSEKNAGFSTADAADLYLPVDSAADAPNVAAQEKDPDSLLNTVKALIALRHSQKDLQADADFEVIYSVDGGYPFIYRRGDIFIAMNPSEREVSVSADKVDLSGKELIFAIENGSVSEEGKTSEEGRICDGGCDRFYNNELRLDAQSFLVYK